MAFHESTAFGVAAVFGESSSLRKLRSESSVLSPTLVESSEGKLKTVHGEPTLVESSECSSLLLKGRHNVLIPVDDRQSGIGAMLDGISNFGLMFFFGSDLLMVVLWRTGQSRSSHELRSLIR